MTSIRRKIILVLSLFFLFLIAFAEIFVILKYMEGESYTILDGIYWVITTISTVGFGDIVFSSTIGKIFTIFVIVYGLFFTFGILFPYIFMPIAERRLLFKLPEESNLKNHVLICGINSVSKNLCKDLEKMGVSYVILDTDDAKVKRAIEEDINAVLSDYSNESFEKNRVKDAMAVVVMEEKVERNVDILLTLRDYNVAKYSTINDPSYARYLFYAGVTKVIFPKSIAGVQLARIIFENVRGVLEIKEIVKDYGAAEIIVSKVGRVVGNDVKEIEKSYGVKVIAIVSDGKLYFDPKDVELEAGNIIYVFGKKDRLLHLFEEARGLL